MTYELLEKAEELYSEIEHYNSLLSLFTTNSPWDDDYHLVILQRVDNPLDRTHFGTEPMDISQGLAGALYDVVYAEKERLEKEFEELGENP